MELRVLLSELSVLSTQLRVLLIDLRALSRERRVRLLEVGALSFEQRTPGHLPRERCEQLLRTRQADLPLALPLVASSGHRRERPAVR